MNIRVARKGDTVAIQEMLEELVLDHPSLSIDNFWITEDEGEIVGVAHLEDRRSCAYLSSVGVAKNRRHEGIATNLLMKVMSGCAKDVYVYTIIPDFFRTLDFISTDPAGDIPSRDIYDCNSSCSPERCECMVLRRNDS